MFRRAALAAVVAALALAVTRADDKKDDKKTDTPKTDKKDDTPKTDKKTDTPKADQPKTDTPKTDTPKVDQPKADDKKPKTDTPKADDKKAEPPKANYTTLDGYYEKSTSGLSGPASHLVFTSVDPFDKVFALVPPMPKSTRTPVTKETFESKLVLAVVKRGQNLWNYEIERVTTDGDTLTLRYKVTAGQFQGGATFASPMVISVDKAGVKKVVFVENGNTVNTVEVK